MKSKKFAPRRHSGDHVIEDTFNGKSALRFDGAKLDCASGFGAVMMVTASFGMVAATQAVDRIVAGGGGWRPPERINPA